MNSGSNALLIFASGASIDVARRRWPKALSVLLETHDFCSLGRGIADVHIFTDASSPLLALSATNTHIQTGSSFGERLAHATDILAQFGYSKIVIVGGDCPDLDASDIEEAFLRLDDCRLVLGPDHRGGCYLIGLHANEHAKLTDIVWRKNSDFCQLREKFGRENTWELPVKIDLDSVEDVRLLACSESLWRDLANLLLQQFKSLNPAAGNIKVRTIPRRERISWQLPPPIALHSLLQI